MGVFSWLKLINNLNQTNSFDSSKKILPFTNTYEYVYDPSIFFKLNLLVYIYIYIERDIFIESKNEKIIIFLKYDKSYRIIVMYISGFKNEI